MPQGISRIGEIIAWLGGTYLILCVVRGMAFLLLGAVGRLRVTRQGMHRFSRWRHKQKQQPGTTAYVLRKIEAHQAAAKMNWVILAPRPAQWAAKKMSNGGKRALFGSPEKRRARQAKASLLRRAMRERAIQDKQLVAGR